ncbi:hypothetical protein RIF29_13717 [Crotalaria pallida]|uniref:Uncharacterized protein n=1 Tax=Crotalaria pallida TaxID=3830 RepID=A0AAN9P2J4_CROPI
MNCYRMAVAAFKSSSRRGNNHNQSSSATPPSSDPPRRNKNKAPPSPSPTIRRSRSVSAFSRYDQFLNKRDNPLFDLPSSNTPLLLEPSTITIRRGRSLVRNAKSGSAATLSRVDSGHRRRSASRCPLVSESEAECKDGNDYKLVGSNRKVGLFGSANGVMDQVKDLRHTWSSQHSPIEVSDSLTATLSGFQTRNCDDAVSTASSGYGSDEKTIKAVCEQMKSVQDLPEPSDIYETVRSEVRRAISDIQDDLASAIQRSNPTAIAVTNVADIPPDLVNPGAVELVLEIRREYAKKLEESQERARNLRADLAVEEHRAQELDRILKEVLPYPMTPNVQKSRPARKASIERRRMSKRLAEDAKAYFDECVSLSTFDSSDFSSQEDPPLKSVGPPIPSGSYVCVPEESSIEGPSMNIHHDITQPSSGIDTVGAVRGQVSSITGSTEIGCKPCFSFAQKPSETFGLQQYIKKFEKNVSKMPTMRSNFCDLRDYSYQSSAESLLIERVILKNRVESRSLILCSGGNMLTSKSSCVGI